MENDISDTEICSFDNPEAYNNQIHFEHSSSVVNYDWTSSPNESSRKYALSCKIKKYFQPFNISPTKNEVRKTFQSSCVPCISSLPFYGNSDDVPNCIEIGFNVFKVPSKSSIHQTEFTSSINVIDNFRKCHLQNTSKSESDFSSLNRIILSFCKNKSSYIIPAQLSPSRESTRNWTCPKQHSYDTNLLKNIAMKTKIHVSHSLSENEDNSDHEPLCVNISNSYSEQTKTENTSSQGLLHIQHEVSSNPQMCNSEHSKIQFELDKSNMTVIKSGEISGISANNTYGFASVTPNLQNVRCLATHTLLTILMVELHISTRNDLKPDPDYDPIRAIFYYVLRDMPSDIPLVKIKTGVFVVNSQLSQMPLLHGTGITCDVDYVESENHLIHRFVDFVRMWDPDIIAGYETEMLSLGYLVDRSYVLGMNLPLLLSRIEDAHVKDSKKMNRELQITGRITLNVWRLLRHEIAVQSYSFENMMYHILHRRIPRYTFKELTFWWDHRSSFHRFKTANYYLLRVRGALRLLDKLDIMGRTSELAKLFGIQFYEVLSRGSQFRVESMMLRLAKPQNFIAVSPSVQQRVKMRAPEFLPLILEPESKLYSDPVIVLDFQSLYPSMIIAYNYCFSTCLGRVEHLGKNTPFEFGATQYKISRTEVQKLCQEDKLNFSPSGVAFVKAEVREGILPKMLREILETRLMIKNAMRKNKNNKLLLKVLHNRQLGLKLIANVTYGYTAANFSGRMPCVEVGDSVVSKGKETLQRAISLVDQTSEWGAKIVYGDTDSLFVLVPGKSRDEAFIIGEKIAEAVTEDNPSPVKLKLEKVYQPCILQTKKRYVGYMYESRDQKEAVYDAKGIETVRRDGCPAVSKMLEKCLKIAFETKDVSLVKQYVFRQFNKIVSGRLSIQDLTFSKEYRGISNYKPGACVPALELAKKWILVDKRSEPRRGERVPYVIVNGPPGVPLIKLVHHPYDLFTDTSLRPNFLYYITKVIIPPINRCFNLFGVSVSEWFNQIPRMQKQWLLSDSPEKRSTISQYFILTTCIICSRECQNNLCEVCLHESQNSAVILNEQIQQWEQSYFSAKIICDSCTNTQDVPECVSLDCPVLYRLQQASRDLQQESFLRNLLSLHSFE